MTRRSAAFGPKIEVDARLFYDMVDRLLSPYFGVHYERAFGKSAVLVRADGEDVGAVYSSPERRSCSEVVSAGGGVPPAVISGSGVGPISILVPEADRPRSEVAWHGSAGESSQRFAHYPRL